MESAGELDHFEVSNPSGCPEIQSREGDKDKAGDGDEPNSPSPRKRSGSVSSEDSDPEPPPVITRKVSFADAFGLDLVSVKEFDSWNTPKKWADNLLDDDRGEDSAEYFLLCLFTVPSTAEELMEKLADQKIELEHVELLPETVALRGIIRVMNLCFEKRVYVRSTLDGWDTHMDLLADFIPGSSDGETDRFSFTLRLVPPCKEERSRVEFCLRYETVFGTFWANNGGVNYVLFCEKRFNRDMKAMTHEEYAIRSMKSCLKASRDHVTEASLTDFQAEDPAEIKSDTVEKTSDYAELHSQEDGESVMDWQTTRRSRRRAARMARVRDHFLHREVEKENKYEETPRPPHKIGMAPLGDTVSHLATPGSSVENTWKRRTAAEPSNLCESLLDIKDSMFATAVEMEAPHDGFYNSLSSQASVDTSQAYSASRLSTETPESWCTGLRKGHPSEDPEVGIHGGKETIRGSGSEIGIILVRGHQLESVTNKTPSCHTGLSSAEERVVEETGPSQQDSEPLSGEVIELSEDEGPFSNSNRSVVLLEHPVEGIAVGLAPGAKVNAQREKETSQVPDPKLSGSPEAKYKLADLEGHKEESWMPEADNSKISRKDAKERLVIPELAVASRRDGASLVGDNMSIIQTETQIYGPGTDGITSTQEFRPEEECVHGREPKDLEESYGKQALIAKDADEGQKEIEMELKIKKEMKEGLMAEQKGAPAWCEIKAQLEVETDETNASHFAGKEAFCMDEGPGFLGAKLESSHGGQESHREFASSVQEEETGGSIVFSIQNQSLAEAGDARGALARESSQGPVRAHALAFPFVMLSDDGEDTPGQSPLDVPGQPISAKMAHVERAETVVRGYLWKWNGLTSPNSFSRLPLCIVLLAVICATAYQYGFLACFALYLFSVCWLICHEKKQHLQEGDRIDSQ
ncbi:uncharacterized protein LOC108931372 [Scleropages formosus]|uniref:uncharacterized protein LOC108931372 n=1 Tax=Scleropages formosus TaxID=113540 RepID=UPI0010FAAA6B|nr:uncharacterized protein LOC108931372 [Scleropages formosus]